MLDVGRMLLHGAFLALVVSIYLMAMMWYNPRLFFNKGDYPDDVLEMAPPKTKAEKCLAAILGIPLLLFTVAVPLASTVILERESSGAASFWVLFLNAFGVLMVFNLVDFFILDCLLFCTITPSFMVVPGTEGAAGYKDYGFHVKAHARGMLWVVLGAAVIAGIVALF